MRSTPAELIEAWIEGCTNGDLRDYCGLNVRTEFMEAAIYELAEAISEPGPAIKWQQKPDKPRKEKKPPVKVALVPPGTSKYHDDGGHYQGVA